MSTNNKIVSIVEDDLDISVLFHEALCGKIDAAASVVSFNDPMTALKHYTKNKQQYAVVISDLRMPNLNGLELLKKVKTSIPKVRTILMSAYNFEEEELYQEYMIETVINSTIAKPVTMKRLYQIVPEELDASAKIAKENN
jgi:DNA-binding NtrC family response regulator